MSSFGRVGLTVIEHSLLLFDGKARNTFYSHFSTDFFFLAAAQVYVQTTQDYRKISRRLRNLHSNIARRVPHSLRLNVTKKSTVHGTITIHSSSFGSNHAYLEIKHETKD